LLLLPSVSPAVSIDWADDGVASGAVAGPTFFLGAPDQQVTNALAGPPPGSLLASFSGSSTAYSDGALAALLGTSLTTLGASNFLVFDRSLTGGPFGSFGFESSHWTFTDGATTFEYDWTELSPASGAVLAAGSVDAASYAAFFGLPSLGPSFEWGFLLFQVPVDVAAPGFQVTMEARPFDRGDLGVTGTPDVDAMGALLPVPVPEPAAAGLLSAALGLGVLRAWRLRGC
jgi:hypothetical protein